MKLKSLIERIILQEMKNLKEADPFALKKAYPRTKYDSGEKSRRDEFGNKLKDEMIRNLSKDFTYEEESNYKKEESFTFDWNWYTSGTKTGVFFKTDVKSTQYSPKEVKKLIQTAANESVKKVSGSKVGNIKLIVGGDDWVYGSVTFLSDNGF